MKNYLPSGRRENSLLRDAEHLLQIRDWTAAAEKPYKKKKKAEWMVEWRVFAIKHVDVKMNEVATYTNVCI